MFGVGILGAFSFWFYIAGRGVSLVRMADYRVSIPDKPWASGVLYSLAQGDYLLVLEGGSPRHCEAYYVELDRRAIGIPNFNLSKYTRFSQCALVDSRVFEKYPVLGILAADWRVDEYKVGIRITGQPLEVERSDPIDNREEFHRQWMPVAYETEIILTKTHRAQ